MRRLSPFIANFFALRVGAIALTLVLLLSSVSCEAQRPSVMLKLESEGGKSSPQLRAELALSRSEQQLGLMYRKELGETEGMLFIFPEEEPRSFWMKNTYVELDIIYLDKDLKVVSISEKAVPLTETPRPSNRPAKYVLEVRGGSAAKWGISAGSRAIPESPLPPPQF